jgi:tetratricopeptide (TPR) repeat protein
VRAALGVGFVALFAGGVSAPAQEIPAEKFREWNLYNTYGWRRFEAGDFVGAAKRFTLAIEAIRASDTADRRLLARSYHDLARALYHQGRYAEAEPLAKWSLAVREAHPKATAATVFQSTFCVAQILRAEKRYKDAEPLYRRALDLQVRAIGADRPETAWTLDGLAEVCGELGRPAEAERLYKRALVLCEQSRPGNNPDVAHISSHYAVLLRRVSRTEEADDMEARAKAMLDHIETKAARARSVRADPRFTGFR